MNNLISDLNITLKQAKKCTFYNNRILSDSINTIEDFQNIPITTKDSLRKLNPYDALCVPVSELYDYHESYGTTGIPLATWFTKNDFMSYVKQLDESTLDLRSDDLVLNRFPYAISVPAHIFSEYAHIHGATIIPVSKASLITPFPRVVNLIRKLKPTIINGMPEELFKIADTAKIMGVDLKKLGCIRALCVAGEMLSNARRIRLENVYGAKVFNYFGCTECGNMATSDDTGNLVPSKDFFFEIVDPFSLKPTKTGIGKILVTTLKKEAFPLVRYDLGDLAELKDGFLIHHGRETDFVKLSETSYTFKQLQEIFLSLPDTIVGNNFRFKINGNEVIFQFEKPNGMFDTPKNYEQLDCPFKYKMEPFNFGEFTNIDKLMQIDKVSKPKYIEYLN